MNNHESEKLSKYLQYLPVIFQTVPEGGTANFLGRFLLAFEKMLSGIDDAVKLDEQSVTGIEQILDQSAVYFDPLTTPADFLNWLAGWVALTLKEGEGWNEGKRRRLIAQIMPLYKKRGTLEGLEGYLRVYFDENEGVTVSEFLKPLQISDTSTIGLNTVVGEGRPFYFLVNMKLPINDRVRLENKARAIVDIINQEKPAYTYYVLVIKVPVMQIGVHSTVGSDSLLGGLIMLKRSFDN